MLQEQLILRLGPSLCVSVVGQKVPKHVLDSVRVRETPDGPRGLSRLPTCPLSHASGPLASC